MSMLSSTLVGFVVLSVMSLWAIEGTSSPCLPHEMFGIVYGKEYYAEKKTQKVRITKKDVSVDYLNKLQFEKNSFYYESHLNYEVLTDYNQGGFVYVTAGGACLFRALNVFSQSDRCKLVNQSSNYGDQYYGAEEKTLTVSYLAANFMVPFMELHAPNTKMSGTFVKIANGTYSLPVYETSYFTRNGLEHSLCSDYTDFTLSITDRSVFTPPSNCPTVPFVYDITAYMVEHTSD